MILGLPKRNEVYEEPLVKFAQARQDFHELTPAFWDVPNGRDLTTLLKHALP
jgi:hypothetical protein